MQQEELDMLIAVAEILRVIGERRSKVDESFDVLCAVLGLLVDDPDAEILGFVNYWNSSRGQNRVTVQ